MEKKKSNKPFYKKWWVIAIIVLLFIGIIGNLTESDETKQERKNEELAAEQKILKEKQTKATQKAEEEKNKVDEAKKKSDEKAAAKAKDKEEFESMDPKSKVEKIINDKLKTKTNTDKERVVSIEQLPEDDESLYFIAVLNSDENLTANLTKHTMWMNTKEILEPISKIENLNKIVLQWQLPLVDSYGNTKDSMVMTINIERDALDKINWENFNVENFPDVSKTYFEHPTLKK